MKSNLSNSIEKKELLGKVAVRFLSLFLILGLLLFITAGTFLYLHAWLYLAALFLPVLLVVIYFFKKDPALLEKRMKFKEEKKSQKKIMLLGPLVYLLIFIVPALDYRFKWSTVPLVIVIIGDLGIWCGYLLFFRVLKENSYASRVIEIQEGQKVIESGPYSVIRHPLYSGVLLIFLNTPIALGSYWGLLTIVPLVLILVVRLLDEEKILNNELAGYEEYSKKVKHRLLPLIW